MNQEVMTKIRKLLALSNSPNEHEAALAASKASDLMIAHGIQASQLIDEVEVDEEVGEEKVDPGKNMDLYWKAKIASAVAELNMCDFWYHKLAVPGRKNYKNHIVFAGKPSKIEVCKETLIYLSAAVERMLEEKVEESKEQGFVEDGDEIEFCSEMNGPAWLRFRNAFKMAAGKALAKRIRELLIEKKTKGIQTEEVNCTALVVQDAFKAARKELEVYKSNIRFGYKMGGYSGSRGFGGASGRAAGNSISLNKQVGSVSRKQLN